MGAWSDPGACMSVDSSLTYKYYGQLNDTTRHYYTGKTSPEFWDTLNQKFDLIKYKTVLPTTDMNVSDVHYFEIIVHWKNKKRRIVRVGLGTDTVLTVMRWLNNSHYKMSLRQSKTPIKFETTFQNPPPGPKIDSVNFPTTTK